MINKLSINWWKWAFLLLLAINIAFGAVIATRVVQVREPQLEKRQENVSKAAKVGTLTSSRKQFNQTVARYLKDSQSKSVSFQLYATSQSIIFEGKYKLLGYEVPLYVYFQPNALKDGSIQLQVKSFSAGTLPLPEKDVLNYLKNAYDLPDYVTIKPSQSSLFIDLSRIKNDANLSLRAKKLDLLNNQLTFDIYKK